VGLFEPILTSAEAKFYIDEVLIVVVYFCVSEATVQVPVRCSGVNLCSSKKFSYCLFFL